MNLSAGLLPDSVEPLTALALVIASFFTSALTAGLGVGGGVLMLALLGLLLPVAALIPVHGTVQLGSNVGRAYALWRDARPARLIPFVIGGALGALLGGMLVVELPDTLLKVVLAVFIIAVTWIKLPPLGTKSAAVLGIGGLVTTALTMFLGATGPLVIALFARVFDNRKTLLANTAIAMSTQHFLKIVVFGFLGFAFASWVPLIVAMIATGYAGTVTGVKLLSRTPEEKFRFWFRIGLTVLALDMIRRALAG